MLSIIFAIVGGLALASSLALFTKIKIENNSIRLANPKKLAERFYTKMTLPNSNSNVLLRKISLIESIGAGEIPNWLIAHMAGERERSMQMIEHEKKTDLEILQDLKDMRNFEIAIAKKSLVKPTYEDFEKARKSLDDKFQGSPLHEIDLKAILAYQMEGILPIIKKKI